MKIIYGITVHNEADELNKLLEFLVHKTHESDEIVICDDFSDEDTQFVIRSWAQQYGHNKVIKVYKRHLEGDFASQKNSIIDNSVGDYIFHIDADEYPHEVLLRYIKQVLEMNEVDLVWVPRVNTVEGITQEHMKMWGWKTTEQGWINYPDFQSRVFRNSPDIRWRKKVHEQIEGCKTYSHLPPHEELSLYHPKTIDKQEEQNKFYSGLMSR